jgi:DNA repair protein RecO (recombination protein O)
MANQKGTTTKTGYVVRVVPYKESDAMISLLTAEGLVSFSARGIAKTTSKNAGSCRLLSFSSFLLTESGSGSFSLKEGNLLKAPPEKEELAILASLSFLSELASKVMQEEEAVALYPWLEEALEAIRGGFDPFSTSLLYFAHLLVESGYGLEVDECVYSGKKSDIVGVSYEDGGFVSRGYESPSTHLFSPRKLKIIRYAFRCPLNSFTRVSFEKGECLEILEELSQYLNDLTGVTLKSLSVLKKA